MIGTVILVSVWMLHTGQCLDISSVELSPFYDAIIFGDIAEIINDIDTNMKFPADRKLDSENESDEEIENLLSEYQHYLEKAEKQRAKYFEKSKSKNKVPLRRRERFSKINLPKTHSHDKNPNYYTSNIQMSQKSYKRPYDLFTPMQMAPREFLPSFNNIIWKENKMRDFPNFKHKSGTDIMLSSCLCEENKFPCKCNCKQCLIPIEKMYGNFYEPSKTSTKINPLITNSNSYTNMEYYNGNTDDNPETNLNIRIKFDIQMPKIDDVLKKLYRNFGANKTTLLEDTNVNSTATRMNVSVPALNFPIPLSIFTYGISKLHNYDYAPIHKISTHKKKKNHTNYQNKKHRTKFLSVHNGKDDLSQNVPTTEINNNDSHHFNNVTQDIDLKTQPNITRELEPNATINISEINSIDHGYILNMSAYDNISTDDNVVEIDTTTNKTFNTDNTRREQNNTTETPQFIRIKREDKLYYKLAIIDNDTLSNINILKVRPLNTSHNDHETIKRVDNKQLLLDSDLLYWPNKFENNTNNYTSAARKIEFKDDINTSEYTTESYTSLHKSLNKINWNDIDTAASTFSALVGKYVKGIITFCSENRCRSIKCGEKICIHRNCLIEARYNQRGHCSSTPSETDSTISMESSQGVSSDIASELVDTLQSQTLGSAYGKATICINIKCITMIANNKIFTKNKCSKKELNNEGHCESLKNAKPV